MNNDSLDHYMSRVLDAIRAVPSPTGEALILVALATPAATLIAGVPAVNDPHEALRTVVRMLDRADSTEHVEIDDDGTVTRRPEPPRAPAGGDHAAGPAIDATMYLDVRGLVHLVFPPDAIGGLIRAQRLAQLHRVRGEG